MIASAPNGPRNRPDQYSARKLAWPVQAKASAHQGRGSDGNEASLFDLRFGAPPPPHRDPHATALACHLRPIGDCAVCCFRIAVFAAARPVPGHRQHVRHPECHRRTFRPEKSSSGTTARHGASGVRRPAALGAALFCRRPRKPLRDPAAGASDDCSGFASFKPDPDHRRSGRVLGQRVDDFSLAAALV